MNIIDKIKILGAGGKWDSCASSASPRKVDMKDAIGNASACGICHSFTENGRCVSLFKTLMTNKCMYDCKYCQNSTHCENKQTTEYEPEELSKVFMNLYIKNYVEGLFLSSGIVKDPDITTEKMLATVNLLREKYKFRGYVHFKILPGTNRELIKQASQIADRLSINIEAPNKSRMNSISEIKEYSTDILRRQSWIKYILEKQARYTNTGQKIEQTAGQTTQVVLGGCDETDWEILKMANLEYNEMKLKRVYYSAFTPVEKTPLENKKQTSYEREHHLYNVDFMIRKYGIKLEEFKDILVNENLPKGDPKMHLARQYFDKPIDVNTATQDELLRVPGIEPQSAERIKNLQDKKIKIDKREQLHSIGVVLKRAEPFIKINGQSQMRLFAYT